MNIGRRQFCALLGAAALTPISLASAATSPRIHGFIDESGKRGDWPLVVGMVATSDPARHDRAIAARRTVHGYARPLLYASGDRLKAGFAEAVIDYFAETDDLSFFAVHASDAHRLSDGSGHGKDAAYAAIYRQVLANLGTDVRLHLKYRPDNPRDLNLRTAIAADPRVEMRVGRPGQSPSHLTQLAGFLAGCIYGEATSVSHPLKAGLIEKLRARTGVEALASATRPRFSVVRAIA